MHFGSDKAATRAAEVKCFSGQTQTATGAAEIKCVSGQTQTATGAAEVKCVAGQTQAATGAAPGRGQAVFCFISFDIPFAVTVFKSVDSSPQDTSVCT